MDQPIGINTNIGKYLGPNKITKFQVLKQKTPGGVWLYRVEVEGGASEVLSDLVVRAEGVVTDKASDWTGLANAKLGAVAAAILELLLEHNVKLSEIDYIVKLTMTSAIESNKEANGRIWGVAEEDQTMMDINQALITDEPTSHKIRGN